MKREEAITILETLWNNPLFNDSHKEALNIAIEALEHPKKNVISIVPCGDAISRQAVLEAIRNLYRDIPIVDIMGARRKWLEKYAPYFECENAVEQLPSVTPQQRTGHWILLDECSNSGYYCSECQKKVVKEGWSNTVKKIKYCPNCGARWR